MNVDITSKHLNYDYNFTVADTGIIGVYGISGSGKSSLLMALAGYEKNHKAVIEHKGKSLSGTIKCSYMSQHPILFSHWTILENLEFALKYTTNNRSILNALIRKLSCSHLLNKLPDQLSGGEKQRIAFIRALILIEKNTIVLLDEPFSALDNKLRKEALNLLDKYKAKNLIFLVTHEISELYQIANELLYIKQGKIHYQDSIENIMSDNLHDLPVASKIVINTVKQIIYADDVSISLTKHADSSIIHQLAVTIKNIRLFEDIALLELLLIEDQQRLFAKITQESLKHLKLQLNQEVIANFKSTSIKQSHE